MNNEADIIKYIKSIDKRLQYFERGLVIRNLSFPDDGSFKFPIKTVDPVSPDSGEAWYNSTDELLKIDPFFMREGLYNDLKPAELINSKVGANSPTLTTFKGNIQQYTFDAVNDEVFSVTELTHTYKEGSDISVHVHWATNGLEASTKYVKWEVEYTIANGNGTVAFPTSTVISTEVSIPANTPDRTYFISNIGTISGVGVEVGAYIVFRFRRIASAGTAPVADPFGIAVGFHTLHDSLGSREIYAK